LEPKAHQGKFSKKNCQENGFEGTLT